VHRILWSSEAKWDEDSIEDDTPRHVGTQSHRRQPAFGMDDMDSFHNTRSLLECNIAGFFRMVAVRLSATSCTSKTASNWRGNLEIEFLRVAS
jgi:hypothetical protein